MQKNLINTIDCINYFTVGTNKAMARPLPYCTVLYPKGKGKLFFKQHLLVDRVHVCDKVREEWAVSLEIAITKYRHEESDEESEPKRGWRKERSDEGNSRGMEGKVTSGAGYRSNLL